MVTLVLIGINLAAFALELAQGGEVDSFVRRWGLVPTDVLGAEGRAALVTLLTSAFLHAGWLHLLSNLLYLGVFGLPVERRVGPARLSALQMSAKRGEAGEHSINGMPEVRRYLG